MPKQQSVAVIGGGIMGGDMATVFAAGGWKVHVMSPSQKTRDALPARVATGLGKLAAPAANSASVTTSARLEDLPWKEIDLVVEAAPEDLPLKQKLFGQLETLAGPDVPLTTNTSNFPIGEVGKDLKRRGRVAGLHFFMPAHLVPLVEIVSSESTDPRVAEGLVEQMKALGKAPIWVKKDVPGFVGNRLQHAMLREALYLVADGIVSPEGIDDAVRYGFGFRDGGPRPHRHESRARLLGMDRRVHREGKGPHRALPAGRHGDTQARRPVARCAQIPRLQSRALPSELPGRAR
jgi:3-hydroxybutyryl-CoA dehydrogenase